MRTHNDDERADESGPLRVTLELARAAHVEDPYAFQFTPQSYIVHTPGGGFSSTEMPWNEALLQDLHKLRAADWEPALVQRVGEGLRRFLAKRDRRARAPAATRATTRAGVGRSPRSSATSPRPPVRPSAVIS